MPGLLNNPEYNIVCLQETWYSKQDLAHIKSLHSEGWLHYGVLFLIIV